ncbi:hypothetical protein [Kitasatospora albolonga]|uniref:hypothetical protein n=1 Tax=Kitasatospora albolonga TaxID=68173 RepID=UPI0031EAB287
MNLIAAYGLTEATVNSTLWPATRTGRRSGQVPIGAPDPNHPLLRAGRRPAPRPARGGRRTLRRGAGGWPAVTSPAPA